MNITINNREFTLRDITQEQWPDLNRATFAHAQSLITEVEQWQEYCYIWRLSSPRFSAEGLISARAYATRHGLPLDELGTMADYR